ncbi:MAG: ABC transporter ATP-binding protein [Pseudomonadota bacterium]
MADPRLQLDSVSRQFGKTAAVNNVSFALEPGSVTALLGRSGCGKSTTLRIAAGVEQQDSGHVAIDGVIVSNSTTHTPPEKRNIGLMFQDFALFPHLNVSQNVGFGLRKSGSKSTGRIGEMLERVALLGFENKYPHELSGGEQQRVALARALAPRPSVLLMDEPFSGLDDRLRDAVREETMGLLADEGASVLMVTHDPEEAMLAADQIILMRAGQVIQVGSPYNIYNAPVDRAAAEFFSDCNVISGEVQGALMRTPFGQFLTPGHSDGTSLDIIIRPQHLKLDFDRNGRGPNPTDAEGMPARGKVKRSRFLGVHSLVEFQMDFQNVVLKADVPGVFLPKPGTVFWLSARRDRCFVFPRAD